MENQEEKKVGIIGKLLGKKSEPEFSAEKAWIESTYGEGTYIPVDVRIKDKQNHIRSSIETKFRNIGNNNYRSYSAYHCVIDIEDDLSEYVDVVFEPFIKNGFTIINLSEQVKEIDEPHVYLVSWKNAFKKHKKNNISDDNGDFFGYQSEEHQENNNNEVSQDKE